MVLHAQDREQNLTQNNEKMIIRVPASTANLGSGFDSIGLAFQLYLTVTLEPNEKTEFIWEGNELSATDIPEEDNLILRGMNKVYAQQKQQRPHFLISVSSEIPLTRGLGSSASAYVAGLVAANEWLNKPLSNEEILWLATEEEGHPDNVGASIFGGVFIGSVDWESKQVYYHHQRFPDKWKWLAAVPSYSLSTPLARNLLPSTYKKEDTVFNVSCYGILVASLLTGNEKGIIMGLEDVLHQPYREHLIPGFRALIEQKDDLGVLGFVISGAGPTVLGLVDRDTKEERIFSAMKQLMAVEKKEIKVMPLVVDQEGYVVQRINEPSVLSEKY